MRSRHVIVRTVGYVLYGIVAFAIFVYLMFPYDLLRYRLGENWSQRNTQLDVASLRPTFPPGLRLQQVRVAATNGQTPRVLMQLDTLRAWPKWMSLLAGTLHAGFEGTLYGGRITGEIRHATDKGAPVWKGQAHFVDLDVARYPWSQQNGRVTVRGRLSGETTVTMNKRGRVQRGTSNLRLQSVVFTPAETLRLFLRRDLPCDTLEWKMTMTKRQWKIARLRCQGDDVLVDIRGTITPRYPAGSSKINLQLKLQSEEAFKQELATLGQLVRLNPNPRGELAFKLRGTLSRPRSVR
ncbi:MAG: type II secretion system protein GspN [Candidatus Tectomicrobia bacterium]